MTLTWYALDKTSASRPPLIPQLILPHLPD